MLLDAEHIKRPVELFDSHMSTRPETLRVNDHVKSGAYLPSAQEMVTGDRSLGKRVTEPIVSDGVGRAKEGSGYGSGVVAFAAVVEEDEWSVS